MAGWRRLHCFNLLKSQDLKCSACRKERGSMDPLERSDCTAQRRGGRGRDRAIIRKIDFVRQQLAPGWGEAKRTVTGGGISTPLEHLPVT